MDFNTPEYKERNRIIQDEWTEMPLFELEGQNLTKLLGRTLFSGLHDVISGKTDKYEIPELSELWNNQLYPNLQFTVGINPYPGYEIDISKGRGGLGRKPSQYATNIQERPYDWKVDITTPMPEWMSELFY